jgi:hypothetical protein
VQGVGFEINPGKKTFHLKDADDYMVADSERQPALPLAERILAGGNHH